MFISHLYMIVKNWKLSIHASVGEWINKYCYIHAMEYYSASKRNKLFTHSLLWMNFKGIMWIIEACLKKLCTVWFHIYFDIFKRLNSNNRWQISSYQWLSMVPVVTIKREHAEIWGRWWNISIICCSSYTNLYVLNFVELMASNW